MALDKSTFTLPVLSSKDQMPYERKYSLTLLRIHKKYLFQKFLISVKIF